MRHGRPVNARSRHHLAVNQLGVNQRKRAVAVVAAAVLGTAVVNVHPAAGGAARPSARAIKLAALDPLFTGSPGQAVSLFGQPTPTPTTGAPFGARSFTVLGAGDILLHPGLWKQGRQDAASGRPQPGYDFDPIFASAVPDISGADLAICHMETPYGAAERPVHGLPDLRGAAADRPDDPRHRLRHLLDRRRTTRSTTARPASTGNSTRSTRPASSTPARPARRPRRPRRTCSTSTASRSRSCRTRTASTASRCRRTSRGWRT